MIKYNKNVSLVFLFFVLLSIAIIICKYVSFMKHHNNKIIEGFKNELYFDLSEDDKKLYFSIIDTYQLILQRDPSEEELNMYFTKLKNNKLTLPDLFKKLKSSSEYIQLNDIQENTSFTSTTVNNDVQDYQLVVNEIQKLMPENKELDPVYIDFLIMKYHGYDKNLDKFRKYIIDTPEYSDYIEEYIKNSEQPETNKKKTEKNENDDEFVLLKDSTNVEYKISPPDLSKSSVAMQKKSSKPQTNGYFYLFKNNKDNKSNLQTDTCEFYNEFMKLSDDSLLADHVIKRNLEQMKYSCAMSKEYENVDSNMKLLPHQKWSVPQKRTPVCHSQTCELTDIYSQTSLIGTLINDVQKEKILPSFKYEETN